MQDAGMKQAQGNEAEEETSATNWVKRIAIILVVIAILAGIGYWLKGLLKGGEVKKQGPTKIQLKDLPPPPPPPPPPKEQPKEQPKDQPKEAPKEPEPKPVEAPPPTDTIKMDGPAGDGPSQFGAGTVTNENKSGETGVIGGKKSLAAFAWYTNKVKSKIEEVLADQKELAQAQYKVVVFVWIASDGTVDRAELQSSSGDSTTDKLIKSALTGMKSIGEAPPSDMPLPVKLRVTSKSVN